MSDRPPILFAIPEYEYMREAMLATGAFERGELVTRHFPDGERYLRVESQVRGRYVAVLGGTISDAATLAVYDLSCSLTKFGARRLDLVMPYYGYSTMERAVLPGEVVTAKTRARLFSAIPAATDGNRVFLVDLHSIGIPHYFEGGCRPMHLDARELILDLARGFGGGGDFVLACTDAGRAKRVEALATELGVPTAFVYKRRLSGDETEITGVSATVEGQKVVIYDDMIRTGGSLMQAARAYREAGAREVYAVATHGVFPGDSAARICDSGLFAGIACSDTHPSVAALPEGMVKRVSVAGMLAEQVKGAS